MKPVVFFNLLSKFFGSAEVMCGVISTVARFHEEEGCVVTCALRKGEDVFFIELLLRLPGRLVLIIALLDGVGPCRMDEDVLYLWV